MALWRAAKNAIAHASLKKFHLFAFQFGYMAVAELPLFKIFQRFTGSYEGQNRRPSLANMIVSNLCQTVPEIPPFVVV